MRSDLISRAAVALVWALLAAAALGGCAGGSRDIPEPDTSLPSETTETAIFFSTGRSLVEEPRLIDAARPYESALAELFAATPELDANEGIAIVQPAKGPKGVTFADGVVTLDWGADVLAFEAEDGEKRLAFAAILLTLGEFPEVEKVRFTVEGKTDGSIDGKDIGAFWGAISLKGQPWDVLRQPLKPSEETSGT